MKTIQLLFFLWCLLTMVSCGNKQKEDNEFDPNVWTDEITFEEETIEKEVQAEEDTFIDVPFEIKGGVKYVPVKINGGPIFDMIFDTGCSGTLISIKEADYLAKSGLLSQEDYRGNANFSIADGSIVENMVFNLKEVIIGGRIRCTDVTATVSKNIQAPMLLGNEIFDRMPALMIDNKNQVVKFKVK